MTAQATFTKKTSLILHNEDYINAGLKLEDMKQALKKYVDNIYMITDAPINSNIELHLKDGSPEAIHDTMYHVELILNDLLWN